MELLRFFEDGVVLMARGTVASVDEIRRAWTESTADLDRAAGIDREVGQGRYTRNGAEVRFSVTRLDLRYNYDWEDRQVEEENRQVIDFSGVLSEGTLSVQWTRHWEVAESYTVSYEPVTGTADYVRVAPP